jgi:aldehyde:ferredoxin oxidoreductase
MAGGYMGRVLWVNLSDSEIWSKSFDENLCQKFLGGGGVGAKVLFSNQREGIDPRSRLRNYWEDESSNGFDRSMEK